MTGGQSKNATDRLTLTRAREWRYGEPAAERIATEIFDAIDDSRDQDRAAGARAAARIALLSSLGRRIDRIVVRLGALIVIVAGVLFATLQRRVALQVRRGELRLGWPGSPG